MLYLKKIQDTDGYYAIEFPIYVRKQNNGLVVTCRSGTLAQGILSPDRESVWQLEDRPSMEKDYDLARIITEGEYHYWRSVRDLADSDPEDSQAPDQTPERPCEDPEGGSNTDTDPDSPDPEDTDPVIPENVDPEKVMTRAELTVKVNELDEALELLLSGVTEDA